jgi:hypothetical protein
MMRVPHRYTSKFEARDGTVIQIVVPIVVLHVVLRPNAMRNESVGLIFFGRFESGYVSNAFSVPSTSTTTLWVLLRCLYTTTTKYSEYSLIFLIILLSIYLGRVYFYVYDYMTSFLHSVSISISIYYPTERLVFLFLFLFLISTRECLINVLLMSLMTLNDCLPLSAECVLLNTLTRCRVVLYMALLEKVSEVADIPGNLGIKLPKISPIRQQICYSIPLEKPS